MNMNPIKSSTMTHAFSLTSHYLHVTAVIHLAVQRGEVAPGPQPCKPVSLHANCRLCKVEVRRTGQLDNILLSEVGEPDWQASNEANLRRKENSVWNIYSVCALCSKIIYYSLLLQLYWMESVNGFSLIAGSSPVLPPDQQTFHWSSGWHEGPRLLNNRGTHLSTTNNKNKIK